MHNLSHPPFCFDFLFICCYCFVTIIFPRLIPIYIFLLLWYFNFSKCCKDTYSDSTVLDFNFMLPSYRICLLFSVQLMRTRTAALSLSQLPLETLKYASPCAVVLPSTWKQPLMCKIGGISLTRKPVIQKFKCQWIVWGSAHSVENISAKLQLCGFLGWPSTFSKGGKLHSYEIIFQSMAFRVVKI